MVELHHHRGVGCSGSPVGVRRPHLGAAVIPLVSALLICLPCTHGDASSFGSGLDTTTAPQTDTGGFLWHPIPQAKRSRQWARVPTFALKSAGTCRHEFAVFKPSLGF